MKQLLVLFALLAVGSAYVWKTGLRVRFKIGTDFGGSHFIDLPRTVSAAVSEGWTAQTQPAGLPVTSVDMYCYPDLLVCGFFDDEGDIAGLQISFPKDNFTPHYDVDEQGFTEWIVNGSTYYSIQQYYTTEEILNARRLGRNVNEITENGGVWVVGVNKEVLYLPNSTNTVYEEGVFTRQSCIPWMGRHYYLHMTPSLSCTDEPLYPWFIMGESGRLISTGLMVFGKLTLDSGARNWFESNELPAIKIINPQGPQCLYDLVEEPGLISMHIYYIDEPWLISCLFDYN